MSKQYKGKPRTQADRHPYLKPSFWANPDNHFWETVHHTNESKNYFRRNLERMMENPHNQHKVEFANSKPSHITVTYGEHK